MAIKKIKVDDNEVEVLNSIENKKPKITKINADEDYKEETRHTQNNPFEEMFKNINDKSSGIPEGMKNNPFMKVMGNMDEIRKIKPYFFFSIVCGLIALFALREYMGVAAILFGVLDIFKGSALTKTASYFGIFLGLVGLVLFIK